MREIAQHKVFIAYARQDLAEVDLIARQLRDRGIQVSTDISDLMVGDVWLKRLLGMIEAADTIIFAVTPAAMSSHWCLEEVAYAERLNKRILPILLKPVIDNIIPPGLARLQYLILTDLTDNSKIDTLVDAIRAGAKYGQGAQDSNVFVSYRREESAHVAGRIYDHLERELGEGKIFFDVEGIPLGGDFREHIRRAILKSEALILVIGQKWAQAFRGTSSWLPFAVARSIDYVKIEIELALDHSVRILPLLVDNATMPSEKALPPKISQICYFQAAPIRAGLDFRTDMARVLNAVRNPSQHATI